MLQGFVVFRRGKFHSPDNFYQMRDLLPDRFNGIVLLKFGFNGGSGMGDGVEAVKAAGASQVMHFFGEDFKIGPAEKFQNFGGEVGQAGQVGIQQRLKTFIRDRAADNFLRISGARGINWSGSPR